MEPILLGVRFRIRVSDEVNRKVITQEHLQKSLAGVQIPHAPRKIEYSFPLFHSRKIFLVRILREIFVHFAYWQKEKYMI